jgi:hypothetical protein
MKKQTIDIRPRRRMAAKKPASYSAPVFVIDLATLEAIKARLTEAVIVVRSGRKGGMVAAQPCVSVSISHATAFGGVQIRCANRTVPEPVRSFVRSFVRWPTKITERVVSTSDASGQAHATTPHSRGLCWWGRKTPFGPESFETSTTSKTSLGSKTSVKGVARLAHGSACEARPW